MKIKVTWQFNDDYAGGSRPQYTYIDKEELDELETQKEKDELIEEYVSQEFEQKGYTIERIEED